MILTSLLSLVLQTVTPDPAFEAAEKRYAACLSLIERSPDDAISNALQWAANGGGMPARHCEALALAADGEHGEAAARLTLMAKDIENTRGLPRSEGKAPAAGVFLAGDIWHQAATSWLMANDLQQAEDAIDRAVAFALEGSTRAARYLIDRARISAMGGDYASAYDDLRRVERADPARRDILVFIASAARALQYLDEADTALSDYIRAYPDDPVGFLELGNLRADQGRTEAAQQAWLKVLDMEETGPNADAARQNLQDMALSSPKDQQR